ncbi:MAG: CaiB/BaiF CoA transferase family protein [Acidimicrobiales bacterium]
MLTPYRVLDLADERGQLAAFILAQLGADVIAVEPPGGTSSRHCAPYAGGVPDPERALWHWSYNRGKRSVVIDLTTEQGRSDLERLAATADIVIDTGSAGVDLDALRAGNPRLVTVRISAFGDDGPRAHWPATELTVWASSGPLAIAGDADRPPVRVSSPQGWLHASGEAADAALVALWERERSGTGQHVSVSAQLASMEATQSCALATVIGGTPSKRSAGGGSFGALKFRIVWPASDGHVTIAFLFGASLGVFTRRLMHWIHEEGFCDEATRDKDWINYAVLLDEGTESQEEYTRVREVVEQFTSSRTKAGLLEGAIRRKLLIAPINTIADAAASEQLAARGFWADVDVGEGEVVRFPGAFISSDRTEQPSMGRAPRLGEHQSLLDDLGPRRAPAAGRPMSVDAEPGAGALAAVKVLDLCWAVAGPLMTRFLADFGATVVRVESSTNLDVARTVGPFIADQVGTENSAIYNNMAAGKLSIALDLSKPEGIEVVKDLIRWADVLTESFAPGVMARLGLDDDTLRDLNPELVAIHSSIMGQTGPLSGFAGIGTMGAAITGFYDLTGWSDRLPAGPFSAYTDYVAPRFGIAALLAALDHRRRGGGGQILDFSQAEGATHFLTPALLDWFTNGVLRSWMGNADLNAVPHGVYRSVGEDSWIAVACVDGAAWSALADVIGRSDMGDLDLEARRARIEEIDAAITEWTSVRRADEAAEVLAAAGVAAYRVQNAPELADDPQVAHLGHFVEVSHPSHGTTVVEGPRARLSQTPGRVTESGPPIGHHAFEILHEILGYDVVRISELAIAEALE